MRLHFFNSTVIANSKLDHWKKVFTARPITLKKNWSRCLYVMPFPVINIWLLICKAPSLMLTEHKWVQHWPFYRTHESTQKHGKKNSREFSEDRTLILSSRFWTSFFCSTFVCKVCPLTEDIKVVRCYTQLSSFITFVFLNYYLKLCKDDVNRRLKSV